MELSIRKKLLLLFFVGSFLILFPLFANASVVESGTCGYGLSWTLDDEGLLQISGSGSYLYLEPGSWTAENVKRVSNQFLI